MEIAALSLKDALRIISTVQTPKFDNSITGSIKLKAENNVLRVEKTNLSQSIRVEIPCKGDIDLAAAWKQFQPAVKELTGDTILIEADNEITLKSGKSKYTCPKIPHEDFPDFLPEPGDQSHSMPQKTLAKYMMLAASCASNEVSRYTLNGIYIKNGVTGTDGRRLLHSKCDFPFEALVPKDLAKTVNLLPQGDVKISISPRRIQFASGSVTVASTLMDPNFPPFETLLTTTPTVSMKLNLGEFLRASRQALIGCGQTPSVFLVSGPNCLALSTEEADGQMQFSCQIEAELTGEYKGKYNANYLFDALDCISKYVSPDSTITVYQQSSNSPMHIIESESHAIIMPLIAHEGEL